jgi:S-DNA-T family DNA segregation ATPase FtsK/SpoIIIE
MDDLYFTPDERLFFEKVITEGLLQKEGRYWWTARFALAKSLAMDGVPDERFRAPRGRDRSELHLQQVTGAGQQIGDYDDAVCMMLSVKHQQDFFADQRLYVEMLQRHIRRGLEEMQGSWKPGASFHDYLLDELYFDAGAPGAEPGVPSVGEIDIDTLRHGLSQIGVNASPAIAPQNGPRLTRFSLTLGSVEDYDKLRRGLDDLAFAIGLGTAGISLAREQGERRVILDIPRPSGTWRDIAWSSLRPALEGRSEALPVCPGTDVMGRPFIFDLVDTPHLFVAGATGSGKSVCLNALLLSLLASRRPPQLVMIDPKGVDFADYNGSSRLRDGRVITDMAAAVSVLRGLVEEMDTRQGILRDYNARNIAEAQAAGAPLERIVVVVDELADFMMSRSGAEEPLIRLAQKARASGIHLILATQRPEAATFPGLLRANIPSRIALTVQKAADSRIILDEGGAENLLMRGDMLIKIAGRELVRVHGARVDPADIRSAVAATGAVR